MEIHEDLLRKVASNARLSLTPGEVHEFLPQLREVFALFSRLDEVDVRNVDLTLQPIPLFDVVFEDIIEKSLSQKEALSNAPHVSRGYFVGPRTL